MDIPVRATMGAYSISYGLNLRPKLLKMAMKILRKQA